MLSIFSILHRWRRVPERNEHVAARIDSASSWESRHMRSCLRVLGFAAALSVAASGVLAGETVARGGSNGEFRHGPYGFPGVYGPVVSAGGYGFADAAIGGEYIGAPFTRFPRPNEIVPPAWGYGTYGVPTVTGIRAAPTGTPTITIINGAGPRTVSRDLDGVAEDTPGGPRIISVTVPRR